MSDFFGDDFTAELKSYFLQSVKDSAAKFHDLLDEKSQKRIRTEVQESLQSWMVDAKTNEFHHLSDWIGNLSDRFSELEDVQDLKAALQRLESYIGDLSEGRADSPDLAMQHSLTTSGRRENLYLQCRIGEQDFVIPIQNVVEVSTGLPIFPVPDFKAGIAGLTPFRGDVLPVVDLSYYGFAQTQESYCFVICEFSGARFSLKVSETEELITVYDKDIQEFDEQNSIVATPFIHRFFIKENTSIMVLDIEKLVA